jgi:hypothetical protein
MWAMSFRGATPILPTEQQQAYTQFGEALLAFSNEPTAVNLVRYLVASQALDDTRGAERHKATRPRGKT